jgi:hypothetical protein
MRRSLALFSVVLPLAACEPMISIEDAGADAPRPGRDSGPDTRVPYDAGMVVRVPESEAAAGRTGCAFDRGAMPWETIGEEFPLGEDIPIRHFILVMQENRSFDHYFGTMEGVDGIAPGMSNPDASGTPVEPFSTTDYCVDDPHHGWAASHGQWAGGTNEGFVTNNGANGARAMGYLTEADLPFYFDLYSRFSMSDHHHCSLLGPTWPNREYYLGASSFGAIGNTAIDRERYMDGDRLIFQGLERAGVDWRIYHSTVPFIWGAFASYSFSEPARSRTERASINRRERIPLRGLGAKPPSEIAEAISRTEFAGGACFARSRPLGALLAPKTPSCIVMRSRFGGSTSRSRFSDSL